MRARWAVVMCLACVVAGRGATAAETAGDRLTVLNAQSVLRYRMAYRTPVLVTASGDVKTPVVGREPRPMTAFRDAPPAAGWDAPGYNDADWSRGRAPVEVPMWTRYNRGGLLIANTGNILCVRGKFVVADPADVKDLRVSVTYAGGAVVRVNGREIARGHLPAGALGPDICAERYPDDVFLDGEGYLTIDMKKEKERLARRIRRLGDVAVPPGVLRKGLNVVAVELRRSAVSEALLTAKRRRMPVSSRIWGWRRSKSRRSRARP